LGKGGKTGYKFERDVREALAHWGRDLNGPISLWVDPGKVNQGRILLTEQPNSEGRADLQRKGYTGRGFEKELGSRESSFSCPDFSGDKEN